jgi:cyclophilin family peptidyl-prolyl cis-trans isomerase
MTRHLMFIGGALVSVAAVAVGAQSPDLQKLARLRNPAALTEQAPATFRANFDTSVGSFVVEVHRDWAPIGADRFYNLVKNGFYDDIRFYRVIPKFMAQFGIHGNPTISSAWRKAPPLKDEPAKQSNKRGFVTFANAGANTRSTILFINYRDNPNLDKLPGFAPFGQVVSGMEVVDKIHGGYGESQDGGGKGPRQTLIEQQGNVYLAKEFPRLDFIKAATIGK